MLDGVVLRNGLEDHEDDDDFAHGGDEQTGGPEELSLIHISLTAAPVVRRILKFWPIKWISNFLLSIADTVIGWFGPTGRTSRVTESEVLAMADVAHEDEAIESEERNFIHSVIEFGDTIVREAVSYTHLSRSDRRYCVPRPPASSLRRCWPSALVDGDLPSRTRKLGNDESNT